MKNTRRGLKRMSVYQLRDELLRLNSVPYTRKVKKRIDAIHEEFKDFVANMPRVDTPLVY